MPPISKRSLFFRGGKESIPLIVGAIPFGIIFGTLAIHNGLSIIETMMLSAFVFAGSAQFIAIGLFAAGAAMPVILFTTFMVNIRHLLYSATLSQYVRHLPQIWRIVLAFGLTDECFAVVKKHYDQEPQENSHWFGLGAIVFFYSAWNISTWIGIALGNQIPNLDQLGLDFAMYVTFTGIVASYLTRRSMWVCMIASGILSAILVYLPHQLGLTTAAVIAMIIATLVEFRAKGGITK